MYYVSHVIQVLLQVTETQNRSVDTGWRKCIGCLELQVSFRKRAVNERALLWKEIYKDKGGESVDVYMWTYRAGHIYMHVCTYIYVYVCMFTLIYIYRKYVYTDI